MVNKQTAHIIKGMRQDYSPSKASSDYCFEANNIRIVTKDSKSVGSIVFEDNHHDSNHTFTIDFAEVLGFSDSATIRGLKILGYTSIRNSIILFAYVNVGGAEYNLIYKLEYDIESNDKVYTTLYLGDTKSKTDLNFKSTVAIECLPSYENEEVQKVYWVDGINPPRVINIAADDATRAKWNNTSFDFIATLNLQEKFEVEKLYQYGSFAPGVIQYCFTYFDKYGRESNIVDVSPLMYIGDRNKGAAADAVVTNNAFKIRIGNIDTTFDYIRLYSIQRTSLDSTIIAKIVKDIKTFNTEVPVKEVTIPVLNSGEGTMGNVVIKIKNKSFKNQKLHFYFESDTSVEPQKKGLNIYEDYIDITLYWKYSQNDRTCTRDLNTIINEPVFAPLKKLGIDIEFEYTDGLKVSCYNTIPRMDYEGIYLEVAIPDTWEVPVYIDNGLSGEIIDPTELLYKGGENIIPYTLSEKDGTLFLGNIILDDTQTTKFIEAKSQLQTSVKVGTILGEWTTKTTSFKSDTNDIFISSDVDIIKNPSYKYLELYRFGVQLQDSKGKWSNPIYITDTRCEAPHNFKESDKEGIWNVTNPVYNLTIPEDLKTELIELGYKRIRPVVVLPDDNNREIVAQGIVCPTVYNLKQRKNDTCAAQSSWFFRPTQGDRYRFNTFPDQKTKILQTPSDSAWTFKNSAYTDEFNRYYDGFPVEYRHNALLAPSYSPAAEFPFMWYRTYHVGTRYFDGKQVDYMPKYLDTSDNTYLDREGNGSITAYAPVDLLRNSKGVNKLDPINSLDYYAVDKNILTFHSPEIEFDKISKIDNCRLRIVGYTQFRNTVRDIFVSQEGAYFTINNATPNNINSRPLNLKSPIALESDSEMKDFHNVKVVHFTVFPWDREEIHTEKKLKYNKSSSLHVFGTSHYFPFIYKKGDDDSGLGWHENFNYPLADAKVFNGSVDQIVMKYDPNTSWDSGYDKTTFIYKGNVDDPLTAFNSTYIIRGYWRAHVWWDYTDINEDYYSNDVGTTHYSVMGVYNLDKVYPSPAFGKNYEAPLGTLNTLLDVVTGEVVHSKAQVKTQPISLTYKSSPHGVLVLANYNKEPKYRTILPRLGTSQEYPEGHSDEYFVDGFYGRPMQNDITPSTVGAITYEDFAPIAEDTNHSGYMYIAELVRDISADTKFGDKDNPNNIWYPAGEAEVLDELFTGVTYSIGDTFFGQYDCLKTYPRNNESFNQVTEIGSFWVETRVNVATRYDANKNSTSNLHVTPNNFNKFNDVYNQHDNFFNYRALEEDIVDNKHFPYTITWSKQKSAGSEIDIWTNVTMASTLDLNGIDGPISKLYNFGNEVFAFQDKAISHIIFNSRVQIPASDNVPIEISNSYKVDGSRKITSVGTSNKFAINSTSSLLYFIDDINKDIYTFDGTACENISSKLGFSTWCNSNIEKGVWSPSRKFFRIDTDHTNKRVYFINNAQCLCYSEDLAEFESFFDYRDSFIASNNRFYHLRQLDERDYILSLSDINSKASYTPKLAGSISFIHSENPFNDKIYNNIDFRMDITGNDPLDNGLPFTHIQAETNGQNTGKIYLKYEKYRPSNLKKKFNVWRIQIPRDKNSKRDRIRNPWAKITLYWEGDTLLNNRELHDIVVDYFV